MGRKTSFKIRSRRQKEQPIQTWHDLTLSSPLDDREGQEGKSASTTFSLPETRIESGPVFENFTSGE
jgi:hypothetical protein